MPIVAGLITYSLAPWFLLSVIKSLHRRKGEADEWRSVLSADQRARATAMLPEDLYQRFGWKP